MRQFSILNLLVLTSATAALVAFIAQEAAAVVYASLFCTASWAAIVCLIRASFRNLIATSRLAIQERNFGRMTIRYKWAIVDMVVITWLIIAIVVSNFVLENSVANAKYLMFVGWGLCSLTILGGCFAVLFQRSNRSVAKP